MKNERSYKLKLWLLLSIAGLAGVLSLLLTEFPDTSLPPEMKSLPGWLLKALLLVNPAVLVLISAAAGTLLYNRAGLYMPLFDALAGRPQREPFRVKEIMLSGAAGGLLAGILIVLTAKIFAPLLPEQLLAPEQNRMHVLTRLLYGGITEEIMLRAGLMSFLLWLFTRVTGKESRGAFWAAVVLTAVVFALGHFPVLLQTVASPAPAVFAYVVIANAAGGVIFGFLYGRKGSGLESAMIAHAAAHVVMLLVQTV